MGLDNGLLLHTKQPVEIPRELDCSVSVYEHEDFSFEYDIFYFRKCWNVRREVAHALGASVEYCGKSWLDIGDVKAIWWALNELNDEHAWMSWYDSIWTWDEIKDKLNQSLLNLEWLIHFMREQGSSAEYMVEFYDSY